MRTGSFDPGVAAAIRTSDALKRAMADLCRSTGQLLVHEQTPWASASFSGVRHRMAYAFEGADAVEAGETMISILPEHEFAIPGQLVADAAVVNVNHRVHQDPHLVVDVELLLVTEE